MGAAEGCVGYDEDKRSAMKMIEAAMEETLMYMDIRYVEII